MSFSKDFLIEWNYRFPVDRWWRQKYSVALFSPEHLEMSQIDIMLEYQEEKLFNDLTAHLELEKEIEKLYKEGIFLKSKTSTPEMEDKAFDDLDITAFNKEE